VDGIAKIKIIPLPKIIKLGSIFRGIPPPLVMRIVILIMATIWKIARVSRMAVDLYEDPPGDLVRKVANI
jgi:hypothetical protein